MKNYIFLFFLAGLNLGCSQTKSKPITNISTEEMKRVVLLDVRTPEEFAAGHLANAININWLGTQFQEQVEQVVPVGKPVYVYCRSGHRSAQAAEKLEALGYNATNLSGGYVAYQVAHEK